MTEETYMTSPEQHGVYIAGPMRGRPAYNFAEFQRAHLLAATEFPGVPIFNPAWNDIEHCNLTSLAAEEGWVACGQYLLDNPMEFSLREALRDDLTWIAENGGHIVFLEGWEKSAGALAEKALGEALGLKFWFLDKDSDEIVPLVETTPATRSFERAFNEAAQFVPDEVRTTSSTGGQKGVKLARYDLIPTGPLKALAEHYGRGAAKYDAHQWRKGYEWSKSYAALLRHLTAFWGGEDIDAETGSHHLAAVAWHAFCLLEFVENFPQHDDRFTSTVESEILYCDDCEIPMDKPALWDCDNPYHRGLSGA